jgi:ribonucleotide reductase alpha subunit
MLKLHNYYKCGNWSFSTDCEECRDYNINTNNSVESSNILELLDLCKPIRAEFTKLGNGTGTNNPNDKYLGAYSSFIGSPISRGQFQFDLWNVKPLEGRYDWTLLRNNIMEYGIRNSLLVAPMPTASTSQILGNNECFEPITSNIYSRKTLAGDFILVNKYLVEDLLKLGLWNEVLKNSIISNKGSVKHIQALSQELKDKYKTVWEMPMKEIINMARDRGAYICQSQSLNLWIEDPDSKILTNMHFYSWKAGLKTGIYYLRRKAKHQAQQFTIEPENKKLMVSDDKEKDKDKDKDCDKEDEEKLKVEDCLMCSG